MCFLKDRIRRIAFLIIALAIFVNAWLIVPRVQALELLVSSAASDEILRYDGDTGAFIDSFASGGGLFGPIGLGFAFGLDGNLYVSSSNSDNILRYNGTTGAFIDVFASGAGLGHPRGLVFGPDDNLYVSSATSKEILRYDGTTGAFIDVFAIGSGLDEPRGLIFGPDGNLYVSNELPDNVLRFNGTTGAFIDVFASGGGLDNPVGLVFGPDGNLYVSSFLTNEVLRYDGTTGVFIDVFASTVTLNGPFGLVFGPDGNLYVSSFFTDRIVRFDGTSGAFIDDFAIGGGLEDATYLIFTPTLIVLLDHFLSYKVKRTKGTAKFEKQEVTLTDQFESDVLFEVKKPKEFYNPADKNDERIIDPNTHLVAYEIKRAKTKPRQPKHVKLTNIEVVNQFGTIFVDTKKPDRLLVPSAKSLAGPIDALDLETIDHFKCYEVKVTKGTPKFEPIQVTLADQFEDKLVDVKKPKRLCNPVEKNGEGIINLDAHLMCYKVKRAKDEPKHEKVKDIHINNQFGPLQVDTKDEAELCVPSTKTLP